MRRLLNLSSLGSTSYDEGSYKTKITGTSDCNEYIPVYAINCHKLLTFKEPNVETEEYSLKVMEYSMPIVEIAVYNYVRTYVDFIYQITSARNPTKYNFKLAGVNHNLNVDKGLVYDNNGSILMCLAINKEYLFNVSTEVLQTAPDYTKFVIFISNMIDEPIYKNIKKKLNELYINIAKEIGLDIVTTSRINNWLFKNNVKPLKFKTVAEMNKHLKEEVPKKILEM